MFTPAAYMSYCTIALYLIVKADFYVYLTRLYLAIPINRDLIPSIMSDKGFRGYSNASVTIDISIKILISIY